MAYVYGLEGSRTTSTRRPPLALRPPRSLSVFRGQALNNT